MVGVNLELPSCYYLGYYTSSSRRILRAWTGTKRKPRQLKILVLLLVLSPYYDHLFIYYLPGETGHVCLPAYVDMLPTQPLGWLIELITIFTYVSKVSVNLDKKNISWIRCSYAIAAVSRWDPESLVVNVCNVFVHQGSPWHQHPGSCWS